jgi:hypothetical protein
MFIMRHRSISTTLAFDSVLDAKGVADALWAGQTNRLGEEVGEMKAEASEVATDDSSQTVSH